MMLYSLGLCLMMPMGIMAMAMSKCPDHCPRNYNPVCGDNGKDYFNECLMTMDACKRHVEIRVAFKGRCEDAGKVDCNKRCPISFKWICGSDGESYPSKCIMEVIACKSKKEIIVTHEGFCGELEEKKDDCNKRCPRIHKPVCGSDGETYPNSCLVKVAACKSKTDITVVHDGECKPEEEEIECHFAARRMKYQPVCGSNGETYGNVCLLKAAACHYGLHLKVVRQGECRDEDLPCPKVYEPVCGSNGETYNSECMLNFVANNCDCHNKITLAHQGECKIKRESDCLFSRKFTYKPVCGNDGQTYYNECLLKANRCYTHTDIVVAHPGRCT